MKEIQVKSPDLPESVPARYTAALAAFCTAVPSLAGVVLARTDGFEVTSVSNGPIPISRLSALSSSLMALGQAALHEMNVPRGSGSILIEGQEGKMLLLAVPEPGAPMVLAAVVRGDAVAGTLLWAARNCVRQLITP